MKIQRTCRIAVVTCALFLMTSTSVRAQTAKETIIAVTSLNFSYFPIYAAFGWRILVQDEAEAHAGMGFAMQQIKED